MARKERKTVYCSGPLFAPEETATMAAIAKTLKRAGYAPFLPHRDGVEALVLNAVNNPVSNLPVSVPINRFISRATFALDIYKVLDCDYFIFNSNGRVPDEGGVVETGVAFAAGKPIVIYKDDSRSAFPGGDNLMLAGVAELCGRAGSIEEIPERLAEVAGRTEASPYPDSGLPGFIREVTGFGRKAWTALRVAKSFRPPNMMRKM
ncbi:MAG: nucleoside 2-deoxyribosyltransferase [Candidatus Geothermincolia bacterium]